MTNFNVRYQKAGGHVHVRLFAGPHPDLTHGKNGDLCLTEPEWESFQRCFNSHGTDTVAFIPEE